MGTLNDFAGSVDSMVHAIDVYPNFLCLLILYVAIYGISVLLTGVLSGTLALIDISARYLHPRKDTWLSPQTFENVLNALFALLVTPIIFVTLKSSFSGHGLALWILALDLVAGIYHGVFIGRTIAEYRRLPRFWDLIDGITSM